MITFLLKTLILTFTILLIGLPINSSWQLLLLIIALVLLFYGNLKLTYKKFSVICLSLIIGLFLQSLLPTLNIIEGHNIFVIKDGEQSVFEDQMPNTVFKALKKKFQQNYAYANCQASEYACWKYHPAPNQLYAFAADGIWQQQLLNTLNPVSSRIVSTINFHDRFTARLGTFNDAKYNYYNPPNNNIHRDDMPFFIAYKFPQAALGMRLHWQGEILWPTTTGDYQTIKHEVLAARTIQAADINKEIYIVGVDPNTAPTAKLERSFLFTVYDIAKYAIAIIAGAIIFNLSLCWPTANRKSLIIAGCCVALQIITIFLYAKTLLTGLPILTGGGDGLVFYGYGREIAAALSSHNWLAALRGQEEIFYFMPGLRYFFAVSMLLFGDTFYGYTLFMSFFLLIMHNFLRLIFNNKFTLYLLILFFIPVMKFFGFANFFYLKSAVTGYSEALSYGCFLLAVTWLVTYKDKPSPAYRWYGFWGNALLAFAVFLRPNMFIISCALMAWFLSNRLKTKQADLIICAIGFCPVLFMLAHNVYFGGEFSLFTSAVNLKINILVPPITYLHALQEILQGITDGSNLATIKQHLYMWNRWVYFFRLPFLGLTFWALFANKATPRIRLLACLAILLQCQMLFFNPRLRYSALAWLFCFVCTISIFHISPNQIPWITNTSKKTRKYLQYIYTNFKQLVYNSPLITQNRY